MAERCSAWRGFEGGTWEKEINVRSFIKHNYVPYDGDETFLAGLSMGADGGIGSTLCDQLFGKRVMLPLLCPITLPRIGIVAIDTA